MATKKVKEVILLLQMNGWHLERIRGSHCIFTKPGSSRSLPVPGKDSKEMPEGVHMRILREAGLK